MEYPVFTIRSREELKNCPQFQIDQFQWVCRVRPESAGRMGWLPGEGLLVRLDCKEENPRRIYQNPQDPVCQDSAMEAFFAFDDPCTNDCMYLNFELNANGAMHAKYGFGRKGRLPISPAEYAACGVHAEIHPASWSVEFLVPLALLQAHCGVETFAPGDGFYCNFYKISESKEIEHYASFSPIGSETPNFHLPEFFARAAIQ